MRRAANGPHAQLVEEGGPVGGLWFPGRDARVGGPEVIGAPEGCDPDQGRGGWGREKLSLSLRPPAKGVPAS